MATRPVSVRFSSEGAAQVEADLRRIGDGDRHIKRIEAASKPASAGLKAIDAAAREATAGMGRLTQGLGPLAGLATSLGPVGVAVGAVSAGLLAISRAGVAASREIATIGDAADRLQIDPELFERLGAALTISGQSDQGLEAALRTLQNQLGNAQNGAKEAQKAFSALGVEIGGELPDVIEQIADGFARIEEPAARAAAAQRLFGEQGGALLSILARGGDGFRALGAEAEKLGLLYGGDLIRESQAVTAELAMQSEIVSNKLNVALAPFARLWIDVKEAVAGALGPLGAVLNVMRDIFGLTSDGENRAKLRGQLESKIADLEGLLETGPTNPLGGDVGEKVLERFEARKSDIRRQLADARAELKMLEEPGAGASTFTPPTFPTTAEGGGKSGKDAFDNAVAAAERQIQTINSQIETFGQARGAAEAYRLEQDLLTAAMMQFGMVTEGSRTIAKVYADDLRAAGERIEAMTAAQRAQDDESRRAAAMYENLAASASNFVTAVAGAEDPLKAMLRVLVEIAAQTATGSGPFGALANTLLGGAGGLAGAVAGALSGGGGGITAPVLASGGLYANGAAFANGNVIPFASGGVIDRPTLFPMSGGRTGLMGEDDPEAIMPLKIGRDGKLGVSASGGGAGVVQNNYIDARGATDPAAVEAAARRGAAMALAQVPGVNRDMQRRGRL